MQKKEARHLFNPSLFWDVDINNINIDKHAKYIIERVIKKGTRKDWQTTLKLYGKETILDKSINIRDLDNKSLNYLSIYFNIDKTKFRCFN